MPGKVLAQIDGKPMIQHVYERVAKSKFINKVYVGAAEDKILQTVKSFGGNAIQTSGKHTNGTECIAEVAQQIDADIIVNIQADEPLIEEQMITDLVKSLAGHPLASMSTLVAPISKERAQDSNVVKIVFDLNKNVLYMSRSVIPSLRNEGKIYMHIGAYAYRKNALLKFIKLPDTPLQTAESTEIMRLVEHGYKIKVIEVDKEPLSVDTQEDLEQVRKLMEK